MSVSPARRAPLEAWRFVVLIVPVLAFLVLLRAAVVPDPSQRNYEYFPEMVYSPAVETQSVAPQLPGGDSQLALVAGVVPRGTQPFHYGPEPEEAIRAGRELQSPLDAADREALDRGAQVFSVHCVPCHDATGGGRGPAVLRGVLPPPSLAGATAVGMEDGTMFHLLTLGRGNMPAMGGRLSTRDRWAVILHVRRLQAPDAEEDR